MHTLTLIFSAFLALLFIAFTPWRRVRPGAEPVFLPRLVPGRFRTILPFLHQDEKSAGTDFWYASGRVIGILKRMRDLTFIIRELQLRVASGEVSPVDASAIYGMAFAQCWASAIGLAEAAICRIFPSLPHYAARTAAQFHWQLTLRAIVLCLNGIGDSAEGNTGLFL